MSPLSIPKETQSGDKSPHSKDGLLDEGLAVAANSVRQAFLPACLAGLIVTVPRRMASRNRTILQTLRSILPPPLCIVVLWLVSTRGAIAQVTALPPVGSRVTVDDDPSVWRQFPSLPAGPDARVATADRTPSCADEAGCRADADADTRPQDAAARAGPPGARRGVFQGLSVTGTWLPGLGSNDLGVSSFAADLTLGFALPTRESPLLITPQFAVHYLDGPISPELPPRVYDADVRFRYLRRLTERWAMDLAVQPGVHSSFQVDDSDAFRIIGRGLAVYQWRPTTKIVLGIAHLAQTDVKVLPVGGLIVTPNDDWRYDLIVPNPRIARRLWWRQGRPGDETWGYIGGEYGGGVWAIEGPNQTHDTATVNDYRVLVGIERRVPGGIGRHLELGYVFGRTLEFAGPTPDFDLGDTVMLRAGASY